MSFNISPLTFCNVFKIWFGLIVVLCPSHHCSTQYSSLDTSYNKGIEAFSDRRWSLCIEKFEESIHLNKLYNSVFNSCRMKCNRQTSTPIIEEQIDDLNIYEKFFSKTECLFNCQTKGFQELHLDSDVSLSVLKHMKDRKAYDYVHLCYFEKYLLPKAASAAYTYLVTHPDDAQMKRNYNFYIRQPEVAFDEVTDLESDDFNFLYKQGITAYEKKNWGETVATMEEVVSDYIASENRCRVECEGPYAHGLFPDLVANVANSFAFALKCKQKCQEVVLSLDHNSGVAFLAHVLNYLQISYYHLERTNDCTRAVGSYLLLLPDDEDMLENKKIYGTFSGDEAFVPRPEIDFYLKRDVAEKKLVNYIENSFPIDDSILQTS